MNSKTRKHALLSLVVAMFLSLVAIFVPTFATAEGTMVAKVGETEYTVFADALTAARAETGDVTVEIYEKVTLNQSLYGSFDRITFIGKDVDAEIYLEVQGYITATNKTVNFEDLKLSKSVGGHVANAGFMNVAFGIYDVANVNYTNCIFVNGACASAGKVTFEGCTFYRSHDRYGLWAYGDVETIVNNCKFDDIRGIKMFSEGKLKTAELTVTNTVFTDKVVDKPAIVLTSGESVTLAGNKYPAKGVFELDKDGVPNGTPVSSADPITCINDDGVCGVMVDGQIYTTLTQAANVATDGSVVTLLHNSTEDVDFATGVQLDKNGYTADSASGATEITAVAKVGYDTYYDFLEAVKALKANGGTLTLMSNVTIGYDWPDATNATTKQYSRFDLPVTIEGNGKTLTFTGNMVEQNYSAAFRFNAEGTVKNLTMDMSAVPQARFRAISAKTTLVVDNCTFIGNGATNNTRAIIFGEGAGSLVSEVSITDCTFKNWRCGVIDNENGQDVASNLTIADNAFENASVNVSANQTVTFTGNEMSGSSYLKVKSYTNADQLKVTAKDNEINVDDVAAGESFINAKPENITADSTMAGLAPVAKIGTTFYSSMEDLLATIKVGNEIKLTANVELFDNLYIPEDVEIFNGNGFSIGGTYTGGNYYIVLSDDIEFVGHVITSGVDIMYTGLTITIDKGACLEVTGPNRLTVGHNTTFNITGNIVDAKTDDLANVQPSLIMPGASFTGKDLNFNATNAYIKATAYCSSSKYASGTFKFDINNCVWEQAGKLSFEAQSTAATVDFNLVDSVLTTTSHLLFSTKGNYVIDNSNVNVGKSYQIENRGNLIVKNGSVVNGANATSSNANMAGTLTVENATYATTGEYSASGLGIGTLIIKSGAKVSLGQISKTKVYKEVDGEFTLGGTKIEDANGQTALEIFNSLQKGETEFYVLDKYEFAITLSKNALKANESITATVSIDKAYYSAEYAFTYDQTVFTCSADLDDDGVIYVNNLFNGQAKNLATYTLIAKNDITAVSSSEVRVTGNVIQYKEQTINNVINPVIGDVEEIKISLDYVAVVKADYVLGYSLVLVSGQDSGYAYNGKTMYFVEAYNAYAIIVKGAVTAEDIDQALSKTTGCEVIRSSYNVNAEYVTDGLVDLKDATAVYACVNKDFVVEDYMELFLRADVNGDKVVNIIDVNEVTKNYTR